MNAKGIPAGDILVVGVETTVNGDTTTSLWREQADLGARAELREPALVDRQRLRVRGQGNSGHATGSGEAGKS